MNLLDRFSSSARDTADTTRNRAKLAVHGSDRPPFGAVVLAALLGAAGGAVASLLLDPDRGRARRAQLTDQAAAIARRVVRSGTGVVNQVQSTVHGRVAAIRAEHTPSARPTDDATLTDRVRSIVFRDGAVPKGDLNVNVERGIVVLRGEIPDDEMRARLVSEVEAIDGVWSVRDLLHLPGEPAQAVAATS
jgi:osmotically-inducible protein OsmY